MPIADVQIKESSTYYESLFESGSYHANRKNMFCSYFCSFQRVLLRILFTEDSVLRGLLLSYSYHFVRPFWDTYTGRRCMTFFLCTNSLYWRQKSKHGRAILGGKYFSNFGAILAPFLKFWILHFFSKAESRDYQ